MSDAHPNPPASEAARNARHKARMERKKAVVDAAIADLFSASDLQVESIPESLPDTLEWFAIDRPNRSLHLVRLNRLEALNVRIALYPEERS